MGKSSALLSATAKHSESHLDKATHYLLNSDSTPDKCTDLIWLLDVQQPDHELLPTMFVSPTFSRSGPVPQGGRPPFVGTATSSIMTAVPRAASKQYSKCTGAYRSPELYAAFTPRIWITHRSPFHTI